MSVDVLIDEKSIQPILINHLNQEPLSFREPDGYTDSLEVVDFDLNNKGKTDDFEIDGYEQIMREYFEKTKGLLPVFDLKNARSYEYYTYIRELFNKFCDGFVPNFEESKIMVCKWMSRYVSDESLLPWPEGVEKKGNEINDGFGFWINSQDGPGQGGTLPVITGVSSNGIFFCEDALDDGRATDLSIFNKLIRKMDRSDILKLNQYILENGVQFSRTRDWDQDFAVFREGYYGENITEQEKAIKQISELLYTWVWGDYWYSSHSDELEENLGEVLSNLDRLVSTGWGEENPHLEEIKNKVVGSILVHFGLSHVVNAARDLLKDNNLDETRREELTSVVRLILNLDSEVKVHEDLNSVYKNIDFENYPVSEETRRFRKDFLEEWFDKMGVKRTDEILDLGCGTGWLVGDLVNLGYLNTVGFDNSDNNLRKAREKYGERFVNGNWVKLSKYFNEGECKVVLSLGRTLPHTETSGNFYRVLGGIDYVLDNGGILIFDMPNPEAEESEYKKKVEEYRGSLRKFGIEEIDIKETDLIIDSPDGLNFYNRYVPTESSINGMLLVQGLEVVEVVREKIPGTEKDENMVFICKKKSK